MYAQANCVHFLRGIRDAIHVFARLLEAIEHRDAIVRLDLTVLDAGDARQLLDAGGARSSGPSVAVVAGTELLPKVAEQLAKLGPVILTVVVPPSGDGAAECSRIFRHVPVPVEYVLAPTADATAPRYAWRIRCSTDPDPFEVHGGRVWARGDGHLQHDDRVSASGIQNHNVDAMLAELDLDGSAFRLAHGALFVPLAALTPEPAGRGVVTFHNGGSTAFGAQSWPEACRAALGFTSAEWDALDEYIRKAIGDRPPPGSSAAPRSFGTTLGSASAFASVAEKMEPRCRRADGHAQRPPSTTRHGSRSAWADRSPRAWTSSPLAPTARRARCRRSIFRRAGSASTSPTR